MKRLPSRRRVAARARLAPVVDRLEARELLSNLPVITPTYEISHPNITTTPPSGALSPAQIEAAYGFNAISFNGVKGDGTGETIAIVDAYDDPNIQKDLNTFDTQYSLPATTVVRVNQTGGTAYPATDSTGGWELEESLDVEWAHAIAPGATIMLVEASSATDANLLAAVSYGSAHANVVSMSWGGGEFSGETSASYDGYFQKAGVAFVASSGDNGAPISWPAASPNVLSVGGTSLTLNAGTYASESAWSGSGGGPSAYVAQPTYQAGVVTQQSTKRGNPDVAYDANPNTGYAIYDSFTGGGGWLQIGGTSARKARLQWSALLAIADQGRSLNHEAPLNSANSQEVMTDLYKLAGTSAFHDVTTGTSTGSPHYSAGVGYDYATGIGSPVANLVVSSLTGGTVTPPAVPDHFVLTIGPSSTVAGSAYSFTVTADTPNNTIDPNYTGTVTFSSSDSQAVLPVNYTFNSSDAGTDTFTADLKTAGSQTITATDLSNSSITITTPSITVTPAAAKVFSLVVSSNGATVGTPLSATLTAKDAYGNLATNYTGTVQLTSSDGAAVLTPPTYTFNTNDAGVHTFSVTFATSGAQTVTATDANNSALTTTSASVAVTPAAPLNLTASAVSSSQINLTWSTAAGATGYQIQRSTNATTGFAPIGTTAAGVTTYQDSTLSAGTTYYYRVLATGNGASSTYSNTANATTTGTVTTPPVTGTSASLWGTTYTPQENAYSAGSFEVGVKFTASTGGTVSGVRFYKESWMGGYTHVGHLWSSTGALLASGTFANETQSGWQTVTFATPVTITANTTYVVSFSTGGGYFGISTNYFSRSGIVNGALSAPVNAGVYGNMNQFPTTNGQGMNFWADVVYSQSAPPSVPAVHPATSTVFGPGVNTSTTTTTGTPSGTQSNSTPSYIFGSTPFQPSVAQAFGKKSGGINFG